jgi:CTP synthase
MEKEKKPKFIIVTGGVISGLGKGVLSACIVQMLSKDYTVVPIKCDGYLNVDPGTMNPVEHGEVFVLDDGTECDMDFGHYERFSNIVCKGQFNITSGKIFSSLIEKERQGKFLGKTVQVIPHATDEIKKWLKNVAEKENADIVVVEIGGTVGDIENMWFLEAARQLKQEYDAIFIHLGLVPELESVGEQKSKPIQQSVKLLNNIGIFPNIILGRSKKKLDEKVKEKISLFCNVAKEDVISGPDVKNIYSLPIIFAEQGLDKSIKKHLGIEVSNNLKEWKELLQNYQTPEKTLNIAICGKYTSLHDSYTSILEALKHCSAHEKVDFSIKWIDTTDLSYGFVGEALKGVEGVIIPGGFGPRGAEGKINVIQYCRENDVPFLGLCYGLQLAIVEFARNVCGLEGANSTEIDERTPHPVIDLMPEQKNILNKGATMRLGSQDAYLKENSKVKEIYGESKITERHRHRYEVNPEYHEILQEKGMVFSGLSKDGRLVEFIELPNKRFFVATQAHPEFKSRFEKPAPLFRAFVQTIKNPEKQGIIKTISATGISHP